MSFVEEIREKYPQRRPVPSLNGTGHAPEPPVVEAPPWPAPLDRAALRGPLGDLVRVIEPHTEADPAAILFQALVAFGSVVGRGPHYRVEATEHHGNEFLVLVGETAKGRKSKRGAIKRKR